MCRPLLRHPAICGHSTVESIGPVRKDNSQCGFTDLRQQLGQSGRWRRDSAWSAMGRSAVVGTDFGSKGRLRRWLWPDPTPKATVTRVVVVGRKSEAPSANDLNGGRRFAFPPYRAVAPGTAGRGRLYELGMPPKSRPWQNRSSHHGRSRPSADITPRGCAMRLQRIARSYTYSNEEDW